MTPRPWHRMNTHQAKQLALQIREALNPGGGDERGQLAQLIALLRQVPGYERPEAICETDHPPIFGLARLSTDHALPAATQILVAELAADLAPGEDAEVRIPFDTGGGLLIGVRAGGVSYAAGAFSADEVIQWSTQIQLAFNGVRERLITNGVQDAWGRCATLFPPGVGFLPLVRIVGNNDKLVVRFRNAQPIAAGSVSITPSASFAFLSAADIMTALARLSG